MSLTKNCVQCGTEFPKPYTESRKSWDARKFCSLKCKSDSQVGRRSPLKGRKQSNPKPKRFLPCRICGEPTKYAWYRNATQDSGVHCNKPECIEASRILKNMRIATTHRSMLDAGTKRVTKTAWNNVSLISPEEIIISPWLESLGWIPQYKVLTGVHTNKLPRMFRLDFALPDRKLYIEIDGSVHKHKDRQARDERRNQMLTERGWTGFRIPSAQVNADIETTKRAIATWIANQVAISKIYATTDS